MAVIVVRTPRINKAVIWWYCKQTARMRGGMGGRSVDIVDNVLYDRPGGRRRR